MKRWKLFGLVALLVLTMLSVTACGRRKDENKNNTGTSNTNLDGTTDKQDKNTETKVEENVDDGMDTVPDHNAYDDGNGIMEDLGEGVDNVVNDVGDGVENVVDGVTGNDTNDHDPARE